MILFYFRWLEVPLLENIYQAPGLQKRKLIKSHAYEMTTASQFIRTSYQNEEKDNSRVNEFLK